MRRNLDLCRQILFKIAQCKTEELSSSQLGITDFTPEEIQYNCKQLENGNLIERYEEDILGNYYLGALTEDGNNLLDQIENDTTWNKVKSVLKEKALPFTLKTILEILKIKI